MEPKKILTKRKIEKLSEEYGYKRDLVENNQIGNEKIRGVCFSFKPRCRVY